MLHSQATLTPTLRKEGRREDVHFLLWKENRTGTNSEMRIKGMRKEENTHTLTHPNSHTHTHTLTNTHFHKHTHTPTQTLTHISF